MIRYEMKKEAIFFDSDCRECKLFIDMCGIIVRVVIIDKIREKQLIVFFENSSFQ